MIIIDANNSIVKTLFLFFINLVNLITNNVIIPQYTSGNIGRVKTPIILMAAVNILTSVTIKYPKKAANIGDLKRYNMMLQNISISSNVKNYLNNNRQK